MGNNDMIKKKSEPQWESSRVKPTMEWIVGYNEFCWRAFFGLWDVIVLFDREILNSQFFEVFVSGVDSVT